MLIQIADVLSPDELDEIRATLAAAPFEDGRATAGWSARLVKDNEQVREDSATLRLLRERIAAAIRRNPVFEAAVRPKALTPLLVSRYGVGRSYGSHVDNPLMGELRTDVSFTLFLAEPEQYEGGELVIESPAGEEAYKLPAGHLVAYPTTALHRVDPVTAGERLVAVGWAQSWIRDAARREILFDLEAAKRDLFEREGKSAAFDLLAKSAANLVRMWAE
ncbi:Fe2+-dependent dioxygenase [Salinarimonas soli]|uniref:Fe2+-dependent dioxygenase n=1 Tax=Salinarimonas soli TaxID=1638099 RepID=A0A5B2VD32_9HYPH|nr:Fe2+-dependent dioxygenase [Salinarimonas soli]KAA2236628.1 Fe2+-dependent dioxygenase [Salinarimonas soli]